MVEGNSFALRVFFTAEVVDPEALLQPRTVLPSSTPLTGPPQRTAYNRPLIHPIFF